MTANRPARTPEPPVGLCARCRFARSTPGKRGQQFWRCDRSDDEDDYPRYPRLPVTACPGFEPTAAQS